MLSRSTAAIGSPLGASAGPSRWRQRRTWWYTPRIPTQPRNFLALASFLLSLVFPVGALLTRLTIGPVYLPYGGLFLQLGYALDILGVPTLIAAIITGHLALSQAHQDRQARRGLAIAALVLGYLSLAFLIGFAIWVLAQPNKFHIVY
jgi:uncharacterized membrane protein